jgi:hypothetical protein
VENDASLQLANLLTRQTTRSSSSALIVTNHQAHRFPLLYPPYEARQRSGQCSKPYISTGSVPSPTLVLLSPHPCSPLELIHASFRACSALLVTGDLAFWA